MATRTYQANDRPSVPRWRILFFQNGSDQGPIFKIAEDPVNSNRITIVAASGKEMTIQKEHAIVLAEDLITHYGTEVGPIVREP